jgi:hypothetical protein
MSQHATSRNQQRTVRINTQSQFAFRWRSHITSHPTSYIAHVTATVEKRIRRIQRNVVVIEAEFRGTSENSTSHLDAQ